MKLKLLKKDSELQKFRNIEYLIDYIISLKIYSKDDRAYIRRLLASKIDVCKKLKNGWSIVSYKGEPIEIINTENIRSISGYGKDLESCKIKLNNMMHDAGLSESDVLTYLETESGIPGILEVKITYKYKPRKFKPSMDLIT